MGLLSWWKGKSTPPPPSTTKPAAANLKTSPKEDNEAAEGLNGAVEVRRPKDVTVFEFGSVAASGDKVTLSGFCPVSDDLEPCHWELLPPSGTDAPQFRIVF